MDYGDPPKNSTVNIITVIIQLQFNTRTVQKHKDYRLLLLLLFKITVLIFEYPQFHGRTASPAKFLVPITAVVPTETAESRLEWAAYTQGK